MFSWARYLVLGLVLSACGHPQILKFSVGGTAATDDSNLNRPRLGDRNHVASVVAGVFGDATGTLTAAQKTSIQANVMNQIPVFGGPCDIYATQAGYVDNSAMKYTPVNSSDIAGLGFTSTMNGCGTQRRNQNDTAQNAVIQPRWDLSSAGVLPVPTVQREGYRIKLCEEILGIDESVKNAVAKLTPAASVTTPPTADQVVQLFQLFYVGQQPPQPVIDSLQAVSTAAQAKGALESWRFTIYTICASPGWQML